MPSHQPYASQRVDKTVRAFLSNDEVEDLRKNRAVAEAMSRDDAFRLGFLSVEDLDDEELRYGRGRDNTGNIPATRKTDLLPRDLYEALVQEHNKRTNEKLRQQLDTALDTMVEIMNDQTAEPGDRFKASQYLFERVAGKTPDRVAVTVKAPWEEVFTGIAQGRGAHQQHQLTQGTIDAEVIPDEEIEAPVVSPYGHIQVPRHEQEAANAAQATPPPKQQPPVPPKAAPPTTAAGENGEANGSATAERPGLGVHVEPVPHPVHTAGDSGDPGSATPSGGSAVEQPPTPAPPEKKDPFGATRNNVDALDERPTVPESEYDPLGKGTNPHQLLAVPDFTHPVNSSATAPPAQYTNPLAAQVGQVQYTPDLDERPYRPLSERLAANSKAAYQRGMARKAANEMRKGARKARQCGTPEGQARQQAVKHRIIARALGLDAMLPVNLHAVETPELDGTSTVRFMAD